MMPLRSAWKEPPSLISLGLIVMLVGCWLAPFGDLDFTWQIRTGEQIVQAGQFRTVDEFSYTIAGECVHDFEWLYEVVLYLAWSGLGVGGLKLLKLVLVFAPLLILGLHLHRQAVPWRGMVISLLVAILVLQSFWNLRAFFCTTIGLLLVATWLHDHCTGRRPLNWWLPVVMLFWANLHPGVIAGQGLLLGAIAWEWLNSKIKLNRPLAPAALRRLTLIGGVALLATLVSPDPLDRLLYPFQAELRHPIMRIFVEMQPLASFLTQTPVVVLLTYLLAGLVAISILLRFREYRLWEIALLGVLALLANFAARGLPDWLLVMLALGVPHITALGGQLVHGSDPRGWRRPCAELDAAVSRVVAWRVFRFQPFWPTAGLVVLILFTFLLPPSRELPIAAGCPCPEGAVAYLQQQGLQGNFFAPPNYGSYLGWSLGARAQVYVDTRGFFFPPQLLEDSHLLPQLGPDWQTRLHRVLNDYPTDYLLLETTGPRGQLWHYFQTQNISPLYLDEQSVLLSADQVRQGLQGQLAQLSP